MDTKMRLSKIVFKLLYSQFISHKAFRLKNAYDKSLLDETFLYSFSGEMFYVCTGSNLCWPT